MQVKFSQKISQIVQVFQRDLIKLNALPVGQKIVSFYHNFPSDIVEKENYS